jgi:hypothetical protein
MSWKHAIVSGVSDDDRALMERLAALEAEVKADANAQRARKEAAAAKVKAAREQMEAERRAEAAKLEAVKPAPKPAARAKKPVVEDEDDDEAGSLGGALELAKKAHGVKKEMTRAPKAGEKSWVKSGVASMLLGPLGWLYAGSFREAIPASAGWLALAAIASKILPAFLLMPVLMVVMPLSGIAGVVYALQYNRHGGRQRLFNKEKEDKQLPPPKKQLRP